MPERIFIDNGLINHLCKDTKGDLWNSFLDVTASKDLYLQDRESLFLTDEMQFLEFIGLGKILKEVPSTLLNDIKYCVTCLFNQKNHIELEEISKTIEGIFAQCLSACEALPKIKPQALLAQHQKHLSHLQSKAALFLDRAISSHCLEGLNTSPQNVYKHICRSLTWHLVITILRSTFNEISINQRPDMIWRFFEPLMATLHRTTFIHGSPPNFFRLVETMYLSNMKHWEKELNPMALAWAQEYRNHQTGTQKDLADCVYLDKALLGHLEMVDGELQQFPVTVLTMDNSIDVFYRLQLSRNVLEKLKSRIEGWRLNPIYSCKILCLEQINGRLVYKDTVTHAIQPVYNSQN